MAVATVLNGIVFIKKYVPFPLTVCFTSQFQFNIKELKMTHISNSIGIVLTKV